MKQDEVKGWGGKVVGAGHTGAPAALYWHCPECHGNSAVAGWEQGEGDSRVCPLCKYVYTTATAGRISQADAPRKGGA